MRTAISTFVTVLFFMFPLQAFPQSVGTSAEALKVIGDFADRLCQTVPLNTGSDRVELSGNAKAELEGIIKKLANLGISGAAKYESTSSQNVLQKDLAEVLRESRNCRLQIWNDLNGKFQIGTESSSKPASDAELSGAPRLSLITCLPQASIFEQIRGADDLIKHAVADQRHLAIGLIDAAEKGNLQCVRALLDAGAPPNGAETAMTDRVQGSTPLVSALQAGSSQIVRELLDRGANPNLRALAMPGQQDPGVPPIIAAASLRSNELVKLLIEKGANVNAADNNGMTALHWAASSGDHNLVHELIERGARTDTKDRISQRTPLEWAKDKDRQAVVQYLLLK